MTIYDFDIFKDVFTKMGHIVASYCIEQGNVTSVTLFSLETGSLTDYFLESPEDKQMLADILNKEEDIKL